MTDEQIIKGLERCGIVSTDQCGQCPCENNGIAMIDMCRRNLIIEAHDLIKRQQAEIEQWKEEANRYQNLWCDAEKDISNARIEAQKDFAERLKEHMCSYDLPNYHYFKAVDEDTLDEVLKEMTEGK